MKNSETKKTRYMTTNTDEEWVDKEIARMVDLGIMRPEGVRHDGTFIYKFDLERLELESPPLYKKHMDQTQEALDRAVQAGACEVHFDDDLNAWYKMHEGVDLYDFYGVE